MNPEKNLAWFSIIDYLFAHGSPFDALVYSRLFWPEFLEIQGMVFLKETFENEDDLQRLSQAMERYGKGWQEVEKAFNLIEIALFSVGESAILRMKRMAGC